MNLQLVYVDTNVLIALIEEKQREVLSLFYGAAEGKISFVTSEISLAEVLVKPLEMGRSDLVAAYSELLTNEPSLRTVAISREILRRSAELRSTLGGKLPDAVHVASALETRCRVLVSNDLRLRCPQELARLCVEEAEKELL
ncbi:type II toxin-antitoxin system VapC family toxin [Jiella endophytica]|uniref:type II toxin-antitoxin system VapC family toxin n=1 Tax=Jiella endophytica TaxID=2558362 RepID=UPI0014315B85|nr:PIN domain-containing protein [Jiella endophytica]